MNANLLDYVILTAVAAAAAAFAGGFGWGISQKVSPGVKNGIRNMTRWVVLGMRWPVSRLATEIREWRRVSRYKHRLITWNDLPRVSKNNVGYHDLSERAQVAIKLHDLPGDEKYSILDKFILPSLRESQFEGTLSLLDDKGIPTLLEAVQITFPHDEHHIHVRDRTGILLSVHIKFEDPQNEIACRVSDEIGLNSQSWRIEGRISMRSRIRENRISP